MNDARKKMSAEQHTDNEYLSRQRQQEPDEIFADQHAPPALIVAPTPPPVSNTFLPPWYQDRNFFFTLVLGIGIMCVVSAYWTAADIGENLVNGMKKYGFAGDESFISLGIMYCVTFFITPIVPIVIDLLSARWAIVAGCTTFVLYVASFLIPSVVLLYCASALLGVGYALQIASIGTLFTAYATTATVERNMAFLWCAINFSLIWGNLFVSIKFQHLDVIDDANRVLAAWVLIGISTCGVLILTVGLGKPRLYAKVSQQPPVLHTQQSTSDLISNADETAPVTDIVLPPIRPTRRRRNRTQFIKKLFRIFWQVFNSTAIRLCFCSMLFYGVESTFFSAVFPTAVGFNRHFGDGAKSLAGLCGVLVGVGEITGGLATALVSKYAGRHTTVLIGFCASSIGFIAAVVNVPSDASLQPSNAPTLLAGSSSVLAGVTAYLLGVGDACLSTSVYSVISDVFGEYDKAAKAEYAIKTSLIANTDQANAVGEDEEYIEDAATTAAFATMNCIQALSTAVTFALSTQVELPWLALAFGVIGAASAVSFFQAHHRFTSGRLKFVVAT